MAKIFWIAEKSGDYMEISAFNNKRKAEEKAMELAPHFSFGDNEVPKEEGDDDGDSWLYSGMINAKECFVLYRGSGMPHADGEFVDEAEVSRWVEQEGYDTAGACFPAKLKGGMGEVYLGSEAEANGSELFVFEDGEVYESNKNDKTMKYVKLFEQFIGSQKVNEYVSLWYSWEESREGEPTPADEKKWAPVLKAFKVRSFDDLTWLAEAIPGSDDFHNNSKVVKSLRLKSIRDDQDEWQDPHGNVDFDILEYKGLLIGDHSDEMRYQGTLVRTKDVKAWEAIYKEEGSESYLY